MPPEKQAASGIQPLPQKIFQLPSRVIKFFYFRTSLIASNEEPEPLSYFFAGHANGRFAASYKPTPAHKDRLKTATEIMLTVGVQWKQP